MDIALLVARLLLAAVFAVAGLAKLADRPGSQQTIKDFGVPAFLAAPLSVILPLAELAVAGALIPSTSAWWGALGALGLLSLFMVAIAINLALGRKPDCHCFGQLASSPIGWPTLVRNVVLATFAGFVIWLGQEDAGASAVAWLGGLTTVERIALLNGGIAVGLGAAMLWLLIQFLGQQGRLLLRFDALETRLSTAGMAAAPVAGVPAAPRAGLPVGAPAPPFRLSGLYGEMLTLDALRAAGRPVLLLFADPSCGPCTTLLPDVGRWQREVSTLTLVVISRGTPEANRVKNVEHELAHVLLQQDHEVATAYQAHGTPSAVVVRSDGTIGSPLAQGVEGIRALVARMVGMPGSLPTPAHVPVPTANGNAHGNGAAAVPLLPALAIGAPAPALKLPDLTGKTVDLAELRGNHTLVLFWNPGCGFCVQMLNDLKAWEANSPKGAPQLLVISTGTVAANRALGLRSLVVLDEGFQAGRAFGATGTPSGVLVDEEGKIASSLAIGAPTVLALIQGEQALSV